MQDFDHQTFLFFFLFRFLLFVPLCHQFVLQQLFGFKQLTARVSISFGLHIFTLTLSLRH